MSPIRLLTNAAKYTEPGGRVTISAQRVGESIEIRVRDTGIGIAPQMLPRVFDLFAQETQALSRSQGGLGLGLTIVRSLVTLHGGTVSAHSAGLGSGTEFTIRLPAIDLPVSPSMIAAIPMSARAVPAGRAGSHPRERSYVPPIQPPACIERGRGRQLWRLLRRPCSRHRRR